MTQQANIKIKLETKPTPIEYEVVWHKKRIAGAVLLALFVAGVPIWRTLSKPAVHSTAAAAPSMQDISLAKFESLPDTAEDITATSVGDKFLSVEENGDSPDTGTSSPAALTTTVATNRPTTPVNINTTSRGQEVIIRAGFASGVEKKEPVGMLTESVSLDGKSIQRLFYFTEFRDYRNHHVVHEWSHNGKLKARVRIGVIADKYRSYSSKYLTETMTGEWQVVVREVGGPILQTAAIQLDK